jgi:hypothetical protein
MHAGITAITELAVKAALSPLPKRRQFGFPRARKRESRQRVSGCETSHSRLRCSLRPAMRTTTNRMAAHRKLDRRRDDLYAGGLRKRAVSRSNPKSNDDGEQ